MRYEMRLTGSGGQGLILAGIIVAEAAVLHGYNAIQTQSYGPEARGGASKSEVIIADEEIEFPKVTSPDLVLAMSPESYAKYGTSAPSDATVIVDSSSVDSDAWRNDAAVALPITEAAREATGRVVTANVVAVGVIAAITGVVNQECVERAVYRHVPARTREANGKALARGFELGRSALQRGSTSLVKQGGDRL